VNDREGVSGVPALCHLPPPERMVLPSAAGTNAGGAGLPGTFWSSAPPLHHVTARVAARCEGGGRGDGSAARLLSLSSAPGAGNQ